MKNSCILLCLLLGTLTAAASAPPSRQGLLVQFSQAQELPVLQEICMGRFSEIRTLDAGRTLYLFSYDDTRLPVWKAIDMVRQLPGYMLHQEDGPVALRASSTNDSFFAQQWHLPLIRATEAWDLTRRGVNGRGDTIVIAVIDDGLHINHPDFAGNIWINYADSAGNGLDDDGNGYTDDRYGWNFMGRNNDISDSDYYQAGHGTPVAGIIGARGNNREGISGIMWQVKLMIVNVADTGVFPSVFQSDVIRAYSYVLHQRKLYNSSGGKKGAFVVAGNSSWGVDGKFPHQAPLWCAFYDSLGKYGVLNVSAVSNDGQNLVDADGDLPTLCPSAHLITVGSTTAGDRYFSSAYSSVSVDLSAPGASIFSTAAYTRENILLNRLYRSGFSGTSFAAPMVTAAIGLLHAYACERVLDTLRLNPAKGNALMRKFLLEGVDVLDDLAGKNASSGRLNIKKALEAMNQYCYGYSGVQAPVSEGRMQLFPNPGNGRPELLSGPEPQSVLCYDLNGRSLPLVLDGRQIDLGSAPAGIYFIHVMSAEGSFVFRYLKTED